MDRVTSEKRSEIMSAIRSVGTKPEKMLHDMLSGFGLDFVRNDRSLPGKPDAVLLGGKVAIFLHGCFWHCHSGCFKEPQSKRDFWVPKLARNVERDIEHSKALKEKGWRVIVVWECGMKPKNYETTAILLKRALGISNDIEKL